MILSRGGKKENFGVAIFSWRANFCYNIFTVSGLAVLGRLANEVLLISNNIKGNIRLGFRKHLHGIMNMTNMFPS